MLNFKHRKELQMKKETKHVFGKDNYLLGKNHDNKKVWLEQGQFDCGWYWGFGYVETYTYKYNDIETHSHFSGLFLNKCGKSCWDAFKEYFKETTLSDKEIWKLLEYMTSFYTLRAYSDMLHSKGSGITNNGIIGIYEIENKKEYQRINDVLIPEIMKNVYALLSDDPKRA